MAVLHLNCTSHLYLFCLRGIFGTYLADTCSQGGFQGFMKQRLCSPDELQGRMLQQPFCVVSALLCLKLRMKGAWTFSLVTGIFLFVPLHFFFIFFYSIYPLIFTSLTPTSPCPMGIWVSTKHGILSCKLWWDQVIVPPPHPHSRWARQSSMRNRLPKVNQSIRDSPYSHSQESHK